MQQKKQNILVIKHGAFGDLIQSDGIFRSIKKKHLNANLVLLTSSSFKKLMMESPYIQNVIIDNRYSFWNFKSYWCLIKKLNSFNFSYIYDLQNSQRTSLYRKFLLKNSLWITTNRKDHPQSGLQGLVDMLTDNGFTAKEIYDPNISWLINDVSNLINSKKISKNYIVLIPGSSRKHKEKRWPYYKELGKEFIKLDYDIVNILGPEELELNDSLDGHKLKLLEWGDLAGVINNSLFVIGNDSGPSHIASCLKKPGLALFGPTTSGTKSELARAPFKIVETKDLKSLLPAKIIQIIMKSFDFLK